MASVCVIEVLGYNKLNSADKIYFEAVFKIINILPLSESIISEAVHLCQTHTITLADSIIAASAIISNCVLVTRNTDDFNRIRKLKLFNPFEK